MENNMDLLAEDNDEIVQSLKIFGVTSTYTREIETRQSLHEIMQDFALNGLVLKEFEKKKSAVRHSDMKAAINNFFVFGNIKMKQSFKKIYKNVKYSYNKSCVFCENNKEPEAVYKSHSVRDSLGKVLCPKLRTYICPICGASGDTAHTVKYCPDKPIITMEDTIKYEHTRVRHTYSLC